MITDFRCLLDSTQDVTHRAEISSGTLESVKHMTCNKTYILDEQLHTIEICIDHGIIIRVESSDGDCIFQMC
jgi:hypothetical protein